MSGDEKKCTGIKRYLQKKSTIIHIQQQKTHAKNLTTISNNLMKYVDNNAFFTNDNFNVHIIRKGTCHIYIYIHMFDYHWQPNETCFFAGEWICLDIYQQQTINKQYSTNQINMLSRWIFTTTVDLQLVWKISV